MATELAMAMRRLRAQEEQARQLVEINRKMDLIMAHLGIEDTAKAEEVPAGAEVETKAEEIPAGDEAAAAEKPPADTGNAKSKKK